MSSFMTVVALDKGVRFVLLRNSEGGDDMNGDFLGDGVVGETRWGGSSSAASSLMIVVALDEVSRFWLLSCVWLLSCSIDLRRGPISNLGSLSSQKVAPARADRSNSPITFISENFKLPPTTSLLSSRSQGQSSSLKVITRSS